MIKAEMPHRSLASPERSSVNIESQVTTVPGASTIVFKVDR
jgi:hypothetical protein